MNFTIRLFLIPVGILFLLLASFLALQESAKTFQKKAERVFTQLASLKVDESTFDEINSFAGHHGFEQSPQTEKCVPSSCTFDLSESNFLHKFGPDWNFLRAQGIKPAVIWAELTVQDGKLAERRFEIIYRSATSDWVSAASIETRAFSKEEECADFSLRRHREYRVRPAFATGALFGVNIEASFTPKATPSERKHGQTFNWACMTSRLECDGPSPWMSRAAVSVMPTAYADYLGDRAGQPAGNNDFSSPVSDCSLQE